MRERLKEDHRWSDVVEALSKFKPPKPNALIIAVAEFLFPIYSRMVDHLFFQFFGNVNQPSLEMLKDKPVVILMNHADRQDPLVVVELARYMREILFCVVAREVFDWNHGLRGWIFQRFGCYSVDRGITDFKSIRTTQKLLTQSHRKLIIFPEAEITGDDRSVHSINRAFVHVLLEAQEEMERKGSGKSIYLLPVGVSYRLITDLEKSVGDLLSVIERKLSLPHDRHSDALARTQRVIAELFQLLARYYKFEPCPNQPQHEQAHLLANHICQTVASYFSPERLNTTSPEQFLYVLRNEVAKSTAIGDKWSPYEKKLSRDAWKIRSRLTHDLDRAERLMILHRILSQEATPIQICRALDCVELEVCGRMTGKGTQQASLFFGNTIELLPYLKLYRSNKHSALDEVACCIRGALQAALDKSHTSANRMQNELKNGSHDYLKSQSSAGHHA